MAESQGRLELKRQRLVSLTSTDCAIAFIKGTRREPRCGFTRQTLELLERIGLGRVRTYDVLRDETVRQELKTYADWPSYPQLWIRGELIGGLDVLKQMTEDGSASDLVERAGAAKPWEGDEQISIAIMWPDFSQTIWQGRAKDPISEVFAAIKLRLSRKFPAGSKFTIHYGYPDLRPITYDIVSHSFAEAGLCDFPAVQVRVAAPEVAGESSTVSQSSFWSRLRRGELSGADAAILGGAAAVGIALLRRWQQR